MFIFSFKKIRKFAKKITIYFLIVGCLTLAINQIYLFQQDKKSLGTMRDKKNDNAYIYDVPYGIQVCDFGNSHGYYGFNYEKYQEEYVCYNFALPSQSMTYNYNILQEYIDHFDEGAYVFICVSYNSFFGIDEVEFDDFSLKNRRYYRFLSNDKIKEYSWKEDLILNYFPMMEIDLPMWKDVEDKNIDIWHRITSEGEVRKQIDIRYVEHVGQNYDENGNIIMNEDEIEALVQMIELCKDKNLHPILITTPFLGEYTEAIDENAPDFWEKYYTIVGDIVSQYDVEYFDYAREQAFIKNYDWYMNIDHLNYWGAEHFTDIIFGKILNS